MGLRIGPIRAFLLTTTALSAAAAVIPFPAAAQQANAPVPAAAVPNPENAGGIEEVVVSANKRQENAQDVPISITAFNEHTLDVMQITDETTLSIATPGLEMLRSTQGVGAFLRGLGGGIGENAVATYVDDVYQPQLGSSLFAFNNLAGIEVDKGPQGTLFGRNAAGGVISITTKDPSSTPHLDFITGAGNYAYTTENLYVTGPITDNLAADLALYYENEPDGWGKNYFNNEPVFTSREWSGRSKWLWTPDDATKIRVILHYSREREQDGAAQVIFPGTVSVGVFPGTNTNINHVGGFYDTFMNLDGFNDETSYGTSVRIDRDFGWGNFTSLTSWDRVDVKSTTIGGEILPYQGLWVHNDTQYSTQEFLLANPDDSKIKWVGGLYFYENKSSVNPQVTYGLLGAPHGGQYWTDSVTSTKSYSAYGQSTVPIIDDHTRFTLGLRYTIDQTSTYTKLTDDLVGTFGQFGASAQWPKLTYKLSLDHDLMQDVLGYITYSRGFKSGAFNTSGTVNQAVAPEVVDNYEMGVKSDFLDHTLRFNAALFLDQVHDLQVLERGFNGIAIATNAAQATYKGIDVDVTYMPVPEFNIVVSAEFLDPRYDSFPNATFYRPNTSVNPATGLPNGGFVGFTGDATGKYVPNASPLTANLTGTYRIPTSYGDLMLVGNLSYHGQMWYDVQDLIKENPYVILNSSVTWTSPDGSWDVKLWGKNLSGTEYFTEGLINTSTVFYAPGAPRTFGVNVGYHWG